MPTIIGNVLAIFWTIYIGDHEHEFVEAREYDKHAYSYSQYCRCGVRKDSKVNIEKDPEWDSRIVFEQRCPDSGLMFDNNGIHVIVYDTDIFDFQNGKLIQKINRSPTCCQCGELEPLWSDDPVCMQCRKDCLLGRKVRKLSPNTILQQYQKGKWACRPSDEENKMKFQWGSTPETAIQPQDTADDIKIKEINTDSIQQVHEGEF